MLPEGTVFLPDLRVDHLFPWRLKMPKRFLLQPAQLQMLLILR